MSLKILNILFRPVCRVIDGIKSLYSGESRAASGYVFKQTDIVGFYNRVEHARIITAVEFVVYTYAMKTEGHSSSSTYAEVGRKPSRFPRTLER